MSDDAELVTCERCQGCEADIDAPDGRWVCFGCYHAIFRELSRERGRKPAVGPIASVVLMWLNQSTRDLDDDSLVTIDGKRSIAAKLIRQAIAELEAE